jgi:hypothetical protein
MAKSNLFLKSGRKGVGRDQPEYARERLLGVPKVVLLLAVKPEVRCRARETRQTRGHLGADGGRAGENPVERLPCDTEFSGRLADGETKARQNPVTKDPPRMGWRRRHGVSGVGHTRTLVKPTVALWVTGRRKQGLPRI